LCVWLGGGRGGGARRGRGYAGCITGIGPRRIHRLIQEDTVSVRLFSDSHLYRTGSLKWTGITTASGEPTIGAWVAEMDFGTAPAAADAGGGFLFARKKRKMVRGMS